MGVRVSALAPIFFCDGRPSAREAERAKRAVIFAQFVPGLVVPFVDILGKCFVVRNQFRSLSSRLGSFGKMKLSSLFESNSRLGSA